MSYITDNLKFENCQVMFKNFSGQNDKFNTSGELHDFAVKIEDPVFAQQLIDDGWNVKQLAPRNEEEEMHPTYFLKVKVDFRIRPPKIVAICGRKQTLLTEDTMECLDYQIITNADVIVSPYNWEVNGKTGVKGYLKTGYFVLEEDEFADKYASEEFPQE